MAEPWFRVHQSELREAFGIASSAVEARSKIPILSNVLITVRDGGMMLRATDLDVQVDARCDLMDVREEAAFSIPADRLKGILSSVPESGMISFGPGRFADHVMVSCGQARISMSFLPATDFPSISPAREDGWFAVDGAALSTAIAKAEFAVSSTEDRIYLRGFCLRDEEIDGKPVLAVVATDGINFARVRCAQPEAAAFPQRDNFRHVILPEKGADGIRKLFDGAKDDCWLVASDSMLMARRGGVTIISKLVDAIYPLYESILPAVDGSFFECQTADLVAGIKRVSVVVDDMKHDAIRFTTQADAMRLDLVGQNGGVGSDILSCAVSAQSGFSIGLNGRQMLRLLASVSTENVRVNFTDAASAVTFTPVGRDDQVYLLMPMRFRNAPGMEDANA